MENMSLTDWTQILTCRLVHSDKFVGTLGCVMVLSSSAAALSDRYSTESDADDDES